MGAHVIAEHSVGESFSGDGLIAVSFDERDRDLLVETSVARQGSSLFGALEYDLAQSWADRDVARSAVTELESARATDEIEVSRLGNDLRRLEAELAAIRSTRLWRFAKPPRRAYAALRNAAARRP